MIVLGIDPATTTGWAVLNGARHVASGSVRFPDDTEPARFGGALTLFRNLLTTHGPHVVTFEQVVRTHRSTRAANIYGGVVACLMAAIHAHDLRLAEISKREPVKVLGIYPQVLKKFATGTARAEKKDVIASARRRWPGVAIVDDNHADALFIALAGGRS